MRFGQILSVLASLSLVGVITVWESQQRVSPGALHPAHASLIELQGDDGCEQCHGSSDLALTTVTDVNACGHCHRAIENQFRDRRGLHGSLEGPLAEDCGRCHRDHHGEDSPLVTAASFALAGIPRRNDYRHHHIEGFPLAGRHEQLACTACHPHADDVEVPRGGGRYLGLTSSCTQCHDDLHDGGFGNDCASCHGQERPFAEVPGFEHAAFELRGAHTRTGCAECHPAGTVRSVEHEQVDPQPTRHCADCHDSPHSASFLATATGHADTAGDCAGCHNPERHDFLGGDLSIVDHAATGFLLEAPHDEVACEQCHGGPDVDFPDRFPGRTPDDCRSCHQDVHRGQFDQQRHTQCTSCHERTHFKPAKFDVDAHARTDFPLQGLHQAVACSACHTQVEDGVRNFGGLDANCTSCHEDVHLGAFDGKWAPLAIDGRRQCGRCHGPSGFEHRAPWFDHAWTGYPLEGRHAELKCQQCHPRSSVPDLNGRYFRPARGRDCALCHQDVHMGQFADEGRADCARCHTPRGFEHSTFDHQRDSRFALDDQHRGLACDKCHETVHSEHGDVVRYKPLGTGCGDCNVLSSKGKEQR
jgi:hypothetical protein